MQIGRRGIRWADRALTTLGIVGMLVALGQGSPDVDNDDSIYGFTDYQGYLLAPDGRAITNIWPFDQDGQPLNGVFLFDQDGVPIEVGEVWDVRPGTVLVPGLYPQPQPMAEYDPVTGGTREVPATPPVVSIPRLPLASSTTTTEVTTTAPPPAG